MAETLMRARDIGQQILKDVTLEEFNSHASKSGEYHAERIIGKGFFGTVFLATSKSGRKVAIKVTKTDFGYWTLVTKATSATSRQARNEVECLRQLRHPYILELLDAYDFTSASGGKGSAIVTEYCAKGNLQQYLEKYRPGEEKRLKWCQQLAEAMKYIHSKLIIHRDIKPDNLLIDSKDDIRIADVGIAKPAWEFGMGLMGITDIPYEMYMYGIFAPPAYLPPEALDCQPRYHRQSDIFSLGLVFVMIVESPEGSLIPYAQYAGKREVLGKLLHDVTGARSCVPTDLLEIQFTYATPSETRLFNKMLAADYYNRPTADDVLTEIKDMNRVRGIKLGEVPCSGAAPGPKQSGCCC